MADAAIHRAWRIARAGPIAAAVATLALLAPMPAAMAAPEALPATLDYRILGVQLRPARTSLAIPKNVAGAIVVDVFTADGSRSDATRALALGAVVEATLRGPSFPARRVVGVPGGDLELPPLPLVGDYSLDEIRLVDTASGIVRLEGTPASVPIHVFDEVLVSRVTSRPLSLEEIQGKGIVIDEKSFRVVEFEVGFVVDGQTIPVRFPVVAPRFSESTEIIPRAELEELLAEAKTINSGLALSAVLPPALTASGLGIEIKGINFQFVEPVEDPGLALTVPPIPGLLVIPGRIGLLNQFFSVLLFTENAAPFDSGLSVDRIRAQLVLPNGPDQRPGTVDAPGDDPLRFARVGPAATVQPIQPVLAVGPDGQPGTPDDVGRLQPGETGQAEFLVEGLAEGLHVMDVTLEASLDGLGNKTRAIRGEASGAVLVRNPKFSLAFGHPRTIRSGEPYGATVTVLNTSTVAANLVSVRLPSTSLSGAVFDVGAAETQELGTILPGETKTATFRLRAQRTGAISFSQFTSDGDISGRFQLRMGVDERGVELSPDAIGYPDFVDDVREIAPELFAALERYFGQALSVATAAQLPPGVARVSSGALQQRIVEVAEAGQRLRYGDVPERVFADLLLDLLGARRDDPGLDQILRTTEAGRELRFAIFRALRRSGPRGGAELLPALAPDLAGRGETWLLAGTSLDAVTPALERGADRVDLAHSGIANAAAFAGGDPGGREGHWLVSRPAAGQLLRFDVASAVSGLEIVVLDLAGDGLGRLLRFGVAQAPAGSCLRHAPGAAVAALSVDEGCDGSVERSVDASVEEIREASPRILAAIQDGDVLVGRPFKRCRPTSPYENYGTVVAILFSKPMSQVGVSAPESYTLEDGNRATSVQIQPGGRVALLNLSRGIGKIRARTLSVGPAVTDPRGSSVVVSAIPIATVADEGVAVTGRVVKGNGEPAASIPVTLTMYEDVVSGFSCDVVPVRAAQVLTDAAGRFDFDFVLAAVPYSVSATDTSGLPAGAVATILESSGDTQVDRGRLLDLTADPATRDTLLAAFSVGALPEAIALAEGLDRALIRDSIELGSARVGSEVPIALRFRGRGSVSGSVLLSDGFTPVAGAAVNLFPDPDSRELGRGVFTDKTGRFAFLGVPLGNYSVDATSPSGRSRTVAGTLAAPGESRDEIIVLSEAVVERSIIEGLVLEPGTGIGNAGARVFVGRFVEGKFVNVVAAVTADGNGAFVAPAIQLGLWDLVAVSQDGRRKAERRDVPVSAGLTSRVNLVLQSRATVRGRVEFANGTPAPNALVAGGEGVVRADAGGFFTLTGVPTGVRGIEAGLEKNPAAGIDFTRLGSAGVNVVAGEDNFVVVLLRPAGRIVGRVFDAAGQPVPNVVVAIPRPGENGFLWVKADATGAYEFENLGLEPYTVSAPGPSVADTDVSPLLETLAGNPSVGDLQAVLKKAFEIFTGVNDPLLNGKGTEFNPNAWGFTKTGLDFDGQTVVANVQFLPTGTVSGTVLNGQGTPIGARVRLTGVGPTPIGDVGFVIRGDGQSDPAAGTFSFDNLALAGDFGVQAATPFFPAPISVAGTTTRIDPDAQGLVLQFPSEARVNGRLAGMVRDPDGRLVGAGVRVRISFGDLEIRTDESGRFDTQIDLPAVNLEGRAIGYAIEAEDPGTGLRGQSFVTLSPGVTTEAEVRLLGKGALLVEIRNAAGAPAAGASVEVDQATFPNERFSGIADAEGRLSLAGLFAGTYTARARLVVGNTAVAGSATVSLAADSTSPVQVVLAGSGTIRGLFLASDRVTPISFGQVGIPGIGFAATDALGRFEMAGVPLGAFRLQAQDPLNGRVATADVSLSKSGQIVDVNLVVRPVGEIMGAVIASSGNSFVPAAMVELEVLDGLTPRRNVTTDPGGFFSFPGTPSGRFRLSAKDPASDRIGVVDGVLSDGVAQLRLDVPLSPITSLAVNIFEADGATPAANATVRLSLPDGARAADTDGNGRVVFGELPLGSLLVEAFSLEPGRTRSFVRRIHTLQTVGTSPDLTLVLGGVARVEGRLLASDGSTPVSDRAVTLTIPSGPGAGDIVQQTGPDGGFGFDNVPIGAFRLVGRDAALAASESGAVTAEDETVVVDLVLGPSGSVRGRLVSQDGTLPIAGADVTLTFRAPSGALGRATVRTPADGRFSFSAIPVGAVFLESIFPLRNGIARRSFALTTNAEEVDLGDVRLDEADPRVVAVSPSVGAEGVPTDVVIRLTFNEALDPALVDPRAIFVRTEEGRVESDVALLEEPGSGEQRILEIRPRAPLASETDHQIVVFDGEVRDALGNVIGQGPIDLVGRSLVVPFTAPFRTRDQDPPGLLSVTPPPASEQVDPRAVIRLSFDESIAGGSVVELSGPQGAVPGRVDVGVGGRVVVFTPDALLDPNAIYTARIRDVRDLAGNLAEADPACAPDLFCTTFATLDTLGPALASFGIQGGTLPVANAAVVLVASLGEAEPGVRVRVTADLVPVAESTADALSVPFTLPAAGTVVLRAVAIDRFGNEGPLFELPVTVQENRAPTLAFRRISPETGAVPTGSTVVVEITASDDAGVREIRASAVGAFTRPLVTSTGAPLLLSGLVPLDTPAGRTVRIFAQAFDASGASSGEQVLEIPVADATLPTAVVLSPAPGARVRPGESFEVVVQGRDAFGVTALELEVTGAVELLASQAVAPPSVDALRSFQVAVPAGTAADASLTLVAVARDAAGNRRASAPVTVRVADVVAPQVVLVDPANGAEGIGPSPTLRVLFSEPISAASVSAVSVALLPASGPALPLLLTLSPDGTLLTVRSVSVLAPDTRHVLSLGSFLTDLAGNPLAETTSAFTTGPADTTAPRLVALEPANGESGVGLRPVLRAIFDEPVSTGSFIAAGLTLRALDAAGGETLVPATLVFESDDTVVRLVLAADLAPGTGHALVLSGSVTDVSGNAVADAGGTPIGTERRHVFTTGGLVLTTPAAGTRVVEGQRLAVTAEAAGALGLDAVVFTTNGSDRVTDAAAPFAAEIVVPDLAAQGGDPVLRLGARGLVLGATRATAPEITVEVNAAAADADEDGLTNGQELAAGTDPFRADATEDPDGDGLTNAEEIALGTAVGAADTDGDGLSDFEEARSTGTDPRDADSDDDGIPDGLDLASGPRLVSTDPVDGASNVSIRPLLRIRFDEPLAAASVTPARVRLLDPASALVPLSMTFADGGRTLELRPDAALAFETSYTLSLASGLTDDTGKPATESDGSALRERTFRTGSFAITAPASGDAVLERSQVPVSASGSAALGIASVEFLVNGAIASTDPEAPFGFTLDVPPIATGSTLTLTAVARDASNTELARASVTLDVVVGLSAERRLLGVALGGTGTLRLLLRAPQTVDLPVTVEGVDPTVVGVPVGPFVLRAGETLLSIPLTGLAEGGTTVVARSDRDVVPVHVSVTPLNTVPIFETKPAPGETPPVIADANGVAVQTLPSTGFAVLSPGESAALSVRFLASPAPAGVPVTASTSNAAVASVRDGARIEAGSTDLRFTVDAIGEGDAVFTLRTGAGGSEFRVRVGPPISSATPPAVAAPVGVAILPLPSAGDAILPAASTRSVTIRLFDAPVASDTTVVVTTSDTAVARVTGSVIVRAGTTAATLPLETGIAGEALLTLRAGDVGRELRVIVGVPVADRRPVVIAAPLGIAVIPLPSAGDVVLPAGATRTLTIRFFDAPIAAATTVDVSTSDASIARPSGSVVIPAGGTDAVIPLETGIEGRAVLTLRAGDVGRELGVIVGIPAPDRRPLAVAAPVGISVIPLPSAGEVIVPAGEARTLRLRLLDSPASESLAIQVVSSDPAVADIAGSVFVPAGSTEVELPIETGIAGEAVLTLRSGDFGRELHVIVGTPPPDRRPAIVAPPLGIVVLEDGFAGTLFMDPGTSRTVSLRLFPFPSLLDLPVTATSDGPSVATVVPAQQTLPTGQEQITLTLAATAPLPAETRVVLRLGPELQTLRVVVGRSDPARAPTTIASPLGIEVEAAP